MTRESKLVQFRLSPYMHDAAKTAAELEGRTLANYITRLITIDLVANRDDGWRDQAKRIMDSKVQDAEIASGIQSVIPTKQSGDRK